MGVAVKNNISLRERFQAVRNDETNEIITSLESYLSHRLESLESTILYRLDAVEKKERSIFEDAMRYVHINPSDKRANVQHLAETKAFRDLHRFCADPSRNFLITAENYIKDGKHEGVRITINLTQNYHLSYKDKLQP